MSDARKRKSFNGHASDSTKRARADQEKNDTSSTYERFLGAIFPPEAEALTHVLDQIDILLMTRGEAVLEAARSGQAAWLRTLVQGEECIEAARALVVAAANGKLECVETLLTNVFKGEGKMWHHNTHKALHEAVGAAATNGHLDTVRFLLRKERYSCTIRASLAALGALGKAVANGHKVVVKFVMQHIEQHNLRTDCSFQHDSTSQRRSLASAIVAGHWSVVEFVLGLDTSWWDLVAAFAAAVDVDVGPPGLADRILGIYLHTAADKSMLVQLASEEGSVNAVKYLFNHGYNQPDSVSKAFETAAQYGHTDAMEFLFGTGLVSSDAFDRALEGSIRMTGTDVLRFLCSKKSASTQAINRAFEATREFKMVQYLYENEEISGEAVIAAFRKAATRGKHWYSLDEVAIMNLLHPDDRIPSRGEGLSSVVVRASGSALWGYLARWRKGSRCGSYFGAV